MKRSATVALAISLASSLFACSGTAPDGRADGEMPTIENAEIGLKIINGTVDSGNQFPNVGAFVIDRPTIGRRRACTGSLIAPRVFLTAAHCVEIQTTNNSDVWVTFDDAVVIGQSVLYHGTSHANPAFFTSKKKSDPHDIAVVVLDEAPVGIPLAKLPPRNAYQNVIHDQTFTAVGYGYHGRVNGGGPPVFENDQIRRFATSTHNSTTQQWLHLSQNISTDDGGTCYGDSGGPNFFGTSNTVASITITGDTVCRATSATYRLDTDSAREFLSAFVTLP